MSAGAARVCGLHQGDDAFGMMQSRVPFTFGIPLLPRACARNWWRIETLLQLTLSSVFAQTDQDFHVIVVGHDRPQRLPGDPRLTFLEARWPVEPVRRDNRDRGRKASAIDEWVRERGGGLLMFLDADDWVDVRLVESARAAIGARHAAGVITAGFAVDFHTLQAAPVPHANVFAAEFHRICGSSVVLQLRPRDPAPLRRDPYRVLHEHYLVYETAAAHGLPLVPLPAPAAYVINTQDNHSELYGPYTEWRREFSAAVNRAGRAVDGSFAARFGLNLDELRAAARAPAAP